MSGNIEVDDVTSGAKSTTTQDVSMRRWHVVKWLKVARRQVIRGSYMSWNWSFQRIGNFGMWWRLMKTEDMLCFGHFF